MVSNLNMSNIKAYSGYFINNNELLSCASGGAATAFSELIINSGGVVFGVCYSSDYKRAEYCCVENINALDKLKGSKYCSSIKRIVKSNGEEISVYKAVENKLSEGISVLFIGLGCDVGAAKAYCLRRNLDTTNLYTIEILCHGPALPEVQKQYIELLEKKYKSKICSFTVRYKKFGWTPLYVRAIFENGKEFLCPFNDTYYSQAFYGVAQPQCTHCNFKGSNHQGDITVGDCWGLDKEMEEYNPNGVSLIIIQTKKGFDLLNRLNTDVFSYKEVSIDYVVKSNPMYYESRVSKNDYMEFKDNLEKRGLRYAVNHLDREKKSLKDFIKSNLKKVIPLSLINLYRERR